MLRLRDAATVRPLNIEKDVLEVIKKALTSPLAPNSKKHIIRKLTDGSPCCVCGGLPSLEVSYPVSDERGNATRIERYCESCIQKVYEREQDGILQEEQG